MIMSTGIDVRLNSNIGGGPDDIKTKDLLDEYDAPICANWSSIATLASALAPASSMTVG